MYFAHDHAIRYHAIRNEVTLSPRLARDSAPINEVIVDICEVVDKGKRACARASSSWDKIVQCGVQINVMVQVLILDSQLGCTRRE